MCLMRNKLTRREEFEKCKIKMKIAHMRRGSQSKLTCFSTNNFNNLLFITQRKKKFLIIFGILFFFCFLFFFNIEKIFLNEFFFCNSRLPICLMIAHLEIKFSLQLVIKFHSIAFINPLSDFCE